MWKNDMGFMWMVALLGHFLQFFHENTTSIFLEKSVVNSGENTSKKKALSQLEKYRAKYNIRKGGVAESILVPFFNWKHSLGSFALLASSNFFCLTFLGCYRSYKM